MKQKNGHTIETLRDYTMLCQIVDSLARTCFPAGVDLIDIDRHWSASEIDVKTVTATVGIKPEDANVIGILLLATLKWNGQIRHLSYYIMAIEGSERLFMIQAPDSAGGIVTVDMDIEAAD